MIRTTTYTAKLSKQSHIGLDEMLGMLRALYNAALEERISAYKKEGKSIGYVAQAKSLTEIRNCDLGYENHRCAIQQNTLKRLDKAYQRFFKYGGFPRFKSYNRGIRSFEWHNPIIRHNGKYNVLQVKGIGKLRFKGILPKSVKFVRVVKTALRTKFRLSMKLKMSNPHRQSIQSALMLESNHALLVQTDSRLAKTN